MSIHQPKLYEIIRRDPRYAYEAYEFFFAALGHTVEMLGGREGDEARHVSGPQLLEGARDLALREFGLMARTVFRRWGINRTGDVGEIIFNLIDAGLMSKTEQDSRADFEDVFDLDEALVRGYRIEVPRNPLGAELPS